MTNWTEANLNLIYEVDPKSDPLTDEEHVLLDEFARTYATVNGADSGSNTISIVKDGPFWRFRRNSWGDAPYSQDYTSLEMLILRLSGQIDASE